MTENEKLRALLAEAREIARSVRNAGSLPYAQWSRDQHEADSVVERIDAALAEPVVDYQRERDEARAEVERLKAHSEVRDRLTASDIRGLLAKLSDALHEGNKTRAEVAAAYQRGAEAMRTAAYNVVEALMDRYMKAGDGYYANQCLGINDEILNLPVPEDKP